MDLLSKAGPGLSSISREMEMQADRHFVRRRGPQSEGVRCCSGQCPGQGALLLEDIWQAPSLSLSCLICKVVINKPASPGRVVRTRRHEVCARCVLWTAPESQEALTSLGLNKLFEWEVGSQPV